MHKKQNNPKTSKNEKKNERCKKFNPHASISTLCLFGLSSSWGVGKKNGGKGDFFLF